jgi:hypothetical protein
MERKYRLQQLVCLPEGNFQNTRTFSGIRAAIICRRQVFTAKVMGARTADGARRLGEELKQQTAKD